jgi:hypothetical protein
MEYRFRIFRVKDTSVQSGDGPEYVLTGAVQLEVPDSDLAQGTPMPDGDVIKGKLPPGYDGPQFEVVVSPRGRVYSSMFTLIEQFPDFLPKPPEEILRVKL